MHLDIDDRFTNPPSPLLGVIDAGRCRHQLRCDVVEDIESNVMHRGTLMSDERLAVAMLRILEKGSRRIPVRDDAVLGQRRRRDGDSKSTKIGNVNGSALV